MPSSSWLVLNAAGLWECGVGVLVVGGGVCWWGGERKKKKVGEILLISSCRFPFLYLTVAPLFMLCSLCLCVGL